jgi:hypothetical protein
MAGGRSQMCSISRHHPTDDREQGSCAPDLASAGLIKYNAVALRNPAIIWSPVYGQSVNWCSWLRRRVARRPIARQDKGSAVARPAGLTEAEKSLLERVEAVESFVGLVRRVVVVEDLKWAEIAVDPRGLAINVALRRQLESIDAACQMCRDGLGHLAVAFVRASIEDVIYLDFFMSLEVEESRELFFLLGNWDSLRSLLAQRDYIGDDEMQELWYPRAFLDHAQDLREKTRTQLKALQQRYKWAGGLLPNAEWIAERSDRRDLYDYLHAATSRALHFSAGETMRRGWGHPSGIVTTAKPEFRAHLAAFSLDQLWRRYVDTWNIASSPDVQAGLSSDDSLSFDEIRPALDRLLAMNRVPLVHAHEWNLTPEGPLDLS